MCITGRRVTTRLEFTRPKLVKTTERLVGTNKYQVKLDGAVFLT